MDKTKEQYRQAEVDITATSAIGFSSQYWQQLLHVPFYLLSNSALVALYSLKSFRKLIEGVATDIYEDDRPSSLTYKLHMAFVAMRALNEKSLQTAVENIKYLLSKPL